MAIRPIRKYGDPILRKKAAPVEEFGPALQQLFADMAETVQVAEGIGLAANQIGRSESLCVVDEGLISPPRPGAGVRAFVNPRLLEVDGEASEMEEGCLSVPDIREEVARNNRVRVRYQDLQGVNHEEVCEGMLARVLQHEVDHLTGIFFIDRLGPVRRKMLSRKLKSIVAQAHQEALERKKQGARVG